MKGTLNRFETGSNCRPERPRIDSNDPVERHMVLVASETALGALLEEWIRFYQALAGELIAIDVKTCA